MPPPAANPPPTPTAVPCASAVPVTVEFVTVTGLLLQIAPPSASPPAGPLASAMPLTDESLRTNSGSEEIDPPWARLENTRPPEMASELIVNMPLASSSKIRSMSAVRVTDPPLPLMVSVSAEVAGLNTSGLPVIDTARPGTTKSMTVSSSAAFASRKACRSVPGPLSLGDVTRNVVSALDGRW